MRIAHCTKAEDKETGRKIKKKAIAKNNSFNVKPKFKKNISFLFTKYFFTYEDI